MISKEKLEIFKEYIIYIQTGKHTTTNTLLIYIDLKNHNVTADIHFEVLTITMRKNTDQSKWQYPLFTCQTKISSRFLISDYGQNPKY